MMITILLAFMNSSTVDSAKFDYLSSAMLTMAL